MTLTIIGFLIGAALALRFNVLILFPSIGLALLGTTAVGIAHGDPMGSVVLTMALIGTTLQVGYLAGIVARAVVASIGESNVDSPRNFAYRILQHSFSMFNSLDLQDHMDVVGSNGEHVGTVDQKEKADRIILTKDDPTEPDRPNKIVFSHAVQAKIGQELRAQFEVPHELPHRMLTLIMQFDANRSGAIR